MNGNDWIIVILVALAPCVLLFFAFRFSIKAFIKQSRWEKQESIRLKCSKKIIMVRLQAYERMILFLERITPDSLLIRISGNNMTARQFQETLLEAVRAEYEHNFTQQLYVTEQSWALIRAARESIIRLVNTAMDELPSSAAGKDLSRKILEMWLDVDESPVHTAVHELKQEVRSLF